MKNKNCWYNTVCLEKCDSSCVKYLKMKYMMDNSSVPKNKQTAIQLTPESVDVESFDLLTEIKDDIETFVNNGENLFICSRYVGNGKTSWATKLLLRYFDRTWMYVDFEHIRGMLVHVPTLLMKLKDFENPLTNEYKTALSEADLIVWDDIAYSTDHGNFDVSNMMMYIDHRMFYERANIFTSNVITQKELDVYIGAKLSDRIFNLSTVIEFKGKGRRG